MGVVVVVTVAVMADRKLDHSERGVSLFGGEKARDRAEARRQMEGLTQNDQVIALLTEQNEMLRYMCDRLYALEQRAQVDAAD